MYCGKCGNDLYKEPLEAFDGQKFCPKCFANLFPDDVKWGEVKDETDLAYADSVIKFVQSEKLYNEGWLLNGIESDLKKALNLCSEASYLKNPYAIVALGYYYENQYLASDSSERDRVRNAFMCYDAVASYEEYYSRIIHNAPCKVSSNGVAPDYDLCRTAAKNVFWLLNNTDWDCSGIIKFGTKLDALKKLATVYKIPLTNIRVKAYETTAIATNDFEIFLEKASANNIVFGARIVSCEFLSKILDKDANKSKLNQLFYNSNARYNITLSPVNAVLTLVDAGKEGNLKEFYQRLSSGYFGTKEAFLTYWRKGLTNINTKLLNKNIKIVIDGSKINDYRAEIIKYEFLHDIKETDIMIAYAKCKKTDFASILKCLMIKE